MSKGISSKPSRMNAVELARFEQRYTDAFDSACIVRHFLEPLLENNISRFAEDPFWMEMIVNDFFSALIEAQNSGFTDNGCARSIYWGSARTWIKRAMKRDAGANAWNLLELYLPGQSKTRADEDAYALFQSSTYDRTYFLRELLFRIDDPLKPTNEEVRLIWFNAIFAALRLVDRMGYPERKARREVFDIIAASGINLAPSRKALAREWFYRFATGFDRAFIKEEDKDAALLPCPFCGGKAQVSQLPPSPPENPGIWWIVSCPQGNPCSVWPTATGDTRREAVDAWNKRNGGGEQ